MRRRTLLLGAAAMVAATGCSRSGGTRPSASTPAVPAGSAPVASWLLTGGYLSAGRLALRPPRLVVYASGEVIADATYRSDLAAEDVADLLSHLAEDLSGSDAAKRKDGATVVTDSPTTVLTVRSGQDTYSATAASLDELRAKNGYPASLYDARDRIGTLHQRVVSTGQPYVAERVRLVVETAPVTVTEVKSWPTVIELPQRDGMSDVRTVNLHGQAARDVVQLLARDLDLNGAWPAYRTSTGDVVRACWRYRLPDE